MAKRTYRDHYGYKHRKHKRGKPQFATITEAQEHTANKKREALKKIAEKERQKAEKEADKFKSVDQLEDRLDRHLPEVESPSR